MDSINQLKEEIKKLMSNEDRRDVEFRLNILLSEIGDAAKYVTHDQELNPNARPHGSKEDEAMSYGQIFVQLIACALLRGIDLDLAITNALKNWQDADWRKSVANGNDEILIGVIGHQGEIVGEAFLDPEAKNLHQLNGHILITKVIKPDHAPFLKNTKAIIADHGGIASHAVIIAREYNIPCIVGVGNATEKIKHGQKIQIVSRDGKGLIIINNL